MSPLRLLGRRGRLLELYRRMVLVRTFETATGRRPDGDHAASEIVVAGAAAALGRDDYVVTSDRPHRFALARGIEPEAVMAGLLGDTQARARCRIVGGGLRAATDLAPGLVQDRQMPGVLAVPGPWPVRPAAFHRAFGIAASRRLPVVFVVPAGSSRDGITTEQVDGADAAAVHEGAARLLTLVHRGQGPAVLEVAVDRAGAESLAPDPLSITAVQLAELGAQLEQLLAIATEAEEAVASAVERLSTDAVSALIRATSPASR